MDKRKQCRKRRMLLAMNYKRINDVRQYSLSMYKLAKEISSKSGVATTTNYVHAYVSGLNRRAVKTGYKSMIRSVSLHYYGLFRNDFQKMFNKKTIPDKYCLCNKDEYLYEDGQCFYCYQRKYISKIQSTFEK